MIRCPSRRSSKDEDVALGEAWLRVISNPEWLLRRVETVVLRDRSIQERFVSLDIDIDKLRAAYSHRLTGDRLLIPIGFIEKNLMLDFDLKDASDQRLSVATRLDNSKVSYQILLAVLSRVARQAAVPQEVRTYLQEISSSESGDGAIAAFDPPVSTPDIALWSGFLGDSRVQAWLELLNKKFILIAVSSRVSGHTIVKYRRLESDPSTVHETDSEDPFIDREWVRSVGKYSIILKPKPASIGWSDSEHFRLQAPEGTFLGFALMLPDQLEIQTRKKTDFGLRMRLSGARASVKTTSFVMDQQNEMQSTGAIFYAGLLPRLHGFSNPLRLLLTMLSLALVLGAVGEAAWGFLSKISSSDTSGAIALLVLLPTVMVAYLVRDNEHVLRSELLVPLRRLVLLSLVPLLVSIVTLFVDSQLLLTWTRSAIWGVSGLSVSVLASLFWRITSHINNAERQVAMRSGETVSLMVSVESSIKRNFGSEDEGTSE